MLTNNTKSPKPLLLKKPKILKNKTPKSPVLSMSIEEKEKIIKAKLISTMNKFHKPPSKRNIFSAKPDNNNDRLNTEIKYPTISNFQVNISRLQ
jgi:hypothetical protein